MKLHPGAGDQYTYLLTISRTDKIDQGVFTCQLEDSGIQQCRSIKVVIREKPFVKIEPMSLTVQKVSNVSLLHSDVIPGAHKVLLKLYDLE